MSRAPGLPTRARRHKRQEALLENKRGAAEIAELGHWSLAPKIPQIVEALEGHRMTDHHRLLIRQSLRHMRYIEEMIEELDKEIAVRLKPYQQQLKLACTVPGWSTLGISRFNGSPGPPGG